MGKHSLHGKTRFSFLSRISGENFYVFVVMIKEKQNIVIYSKQKVVAKKKNRKK